VRDRTKSASNLDDWRQRRLPVEGQLSKIAKPVRELSSERLLQERDEQLAGLAEQLNTRAVEIEHLKLQIAKLRRMQFGRKSEKLDHQIEQLELQLEDQQADEADAAREMPAADQAPRKKSVRRPLHEHLPRDEKIHAPTADACPACGRWVRTWRNNWNSCRPASA
jgi:DNA repair exonuclease SbcCD ATPase subunit